MVMLCDDTENFHILQYQSRKLLHVVRSKMTDELFAFLEGFNAAVSYF